MTVRIADQLWEGMSEEKEHEVSDVLLDLNEGVPKELDFLVSLSENGEVLLELKNESGETESIHLTWDLLRDPFNEYRSVISRLAHSGGGGFGMRDYETLDYAKKLVHDEGAKRIRKVLKHSLCPMDQDDCRSLFTLVFLLSVELPPALVRRHRQHGLS